MSRIYKEMWEGSADLLSKIKEERIEKRYFNKIIVRTSSDIEKNDYITISIGEDLFHNIELQNKVINELIRGLGHYLKKYDLHSDSSVLVIGLGNGHITADSLGSRVCDKITVTKHLYDKKEIRTSWGCLSCIKPSVSGVTGIDSFELIKALIKNENPNFIIAVDTLACGDYNRLGCSIQISDDGVEPGAGVGNPKPKLNYESLNIPVVAIGVPLVIYISKLITNIDKDNSIIIPKNLLDLVVTAKEIDFQIEDYSHIISESINQAVHTSLKSTYYYK